MPNTHPPPARTTTESEEHAPMRFASDLEHPAIQSAVLRYLALLTDTLARTADAVAQGEDGRATALEELGTVELLARTLRRRLLERRTADADATD